MDPIFLILYAVTITLLLTLVFPRLRQANPSLRRLLWFLTIAGGTGLLIMIVYLFTN